MLKDALISVGKVKVRREYLKRKIMKNQTKEKREERWKVHSSEVVILKTKTVWMCDTDDIHTQLQEKKFSLYIFRGNGSNEIWSQRIQVIFQYYYSAHKSHIAFAGKTF